MKKALFGKLNGGCQLLIRVVSNLDSIYEEAILRFEIATVVIPDPIGNPVRRDTQFLDPHNVLLCKTLMNGAGMTDI